MYDVEKDKVFLENFEREMLEYDEHLTMTLDVYLEYLRYMYNPFTNRGSIFYIEPPSLGRGGGGYKKG